MRDKDTLFMKKFFLAIYCFHLAIPLKKLHMGLSNLFDEMRFRLNRRFLPRKFRFKEITYIIKANFSNMVAQRQKKEIVSFINLHFIFKARFLSFFVDEEGRSKLGLPIYIPHS